MWQPSRTRLSGSEAYVRRGGANFIRNQWSERTRERERRESALLASPAEFVVILWHAKSEESSQFNPWISALTLLLLGGGFGAYIFLTEVILRILAWPKSLAK